jgi:histidine triad (HIT) family protein
MRKISFLKMHIFSPRIFVGQDQKSLLGLVLIRTKEHVYDLCDLSESEAEKLGALIRKLSRAIIKATEAEWTYCYCFMEGVRHVHFFIAPRYSNLPKEYVRLNIGNWPNAPTGDENKIADVAKRIRSIVSLGQ